MRRAAGRQLRPPKTPAATGVPGEAYAAPWPAALVAAAAVWLLYVLTLAPTTQFWDTSEYIAAGHIVGIPHPPGNPLFVLLARVWELLLAATGLPVAVRTNLLSATCSALAHGLWFLVLHRALSASQSGRRIALPAAATGVVLSATAFTVWNQSNVNEKVYTISLLTTALLSWLMLTWRDRRSGGCDPARAVAPAGAGRTGPRTSGSAGAVPADRLLVLAAFLLALTATNHMMGLLVAPAMLVFVLVTYPRSLANPRLWAFAGLAALAGLSVFAFLPVRGALQPLINEGDPTTWTGFLESLQRRQYMKPSLLANPVLPYLPRTASLLAAQYANWAQYFDWQWARSVAGNISWFGGLRPVITLTMLGLGIIGVRRIWRTDRASGLYLLVLFLTLSLGLTFYLNFRYGYTYPVSGALAGLAEAREVRERDYFFLIGFSLWGLFSGAGLAALWHAARQRIVDRVERGAAGSGPVWRGCRLPQFAAAPILALALVPAALSWSWATRADDYSARDWAYNALVSVGPYGVLFTNGDNDTFPLWYVQEVEGVRRDVAVVVTSYLNTPWYAKQVRDLTRQCPAGIDPEAEPTRIVCQRPYVAGSRVAAGNPLRPPGDSVLPLTDGQIEEVASRITRLDRPAVVEVGAVKTTVPAGTELTPSDTFITLMLAANLGKRPIHFIVPSPPLAKLNLTDFTVRQGLTFRLENGAVESGPGTDVFELPGNPAPYTLGRYVDVAATERLLREAFVIHRQPEQRKVWADTATKNIPLYYAFAHAALAEAWAAGGESANAGLHADRSRAWAALAQ